MDNKTQQIYLRGIILRKLKSLSVVELFTDFKYNGVSKLDLRGDLMIDLIVDFLATIGDIIADIWVNKIVTKFKKK